MSIVTQMQAQNQHVACRVSDGKWASFALHQPNQTIGSRDKAVVCEVICCGPGNVSRGSLNPCTVKSGDLVVANLFHRSHEVVIFGQTLSTFNWENIMARLHVDEQNKSIDLTPLQGFIVCRTNERRAQRVMMGDSKIINPSGDAQLTGGSSFNDKGKRVEQIKVACEEVVSVGPGAVIDGLWQEPKCLPNDMILYDTSTTPIRFMAGGQSFTLVHWRTVIFTFRDGAPERNAEEAQETTH